MFRFFISIAQIILMGIGLYMIVKGGRMNKKATNTNSGRMPVFDFSGLSPNKITNRHWYFSDKSQVNNFELCDIYYKYKGNGLHKFYSKGDILISKGQKFMIGSIILFIGGILSLFL